MGEEPKERGGDQAEGRRPRRGEETDERGGDRGGGGNTGVGRSPRRGEETEEGGGDPGEGPRRGRGDERKGEETRGKETRGLSMMVSGGSGGLFLLKSTIISTVLSVFSSRLL